MKELAEAMQRVRAKIRTQSLPALPSVVLVTLPADSGPLVLDSHAVVVTCCTPSLLLRVSLMRPILCDV